MNQFLAWLHSHGHHPMPVTPDAIGPGAPLARPTPSSTPYINGMKDPIAGGFVTSEAAELCYAKCIASGNPKLIAFAKSVLPFKFAIQAAQSVAEFAMSDADKFSNEENCQFAKMFWEPLDPSGLLASKTWCPQAFIASAPTGHKLYDQGPTLPGYASFAPSVKPENLLQIFADAMDRSAAA